MPVIDKLAISMGARDEGPNIALAEEIISCKDKKAIEELVSLVQQKNKKVANDCIKVLYEIGAREPKFIAPYFDVFIGLLKSKDNRMVWGAMTALDYATSEVPDIAFKQLDTILAAADSGSVITKDHAIGVLAKLTTAKHAKHVVPILLDQLQSAPGNQFGMYAETIAPVISNEDKKKFVDILTERSPNLEKDSQKKRIEKLLKKITK